MLRIVAINNCIYVGSAAPPSRNAQENTTYQGSAAASFKECTGEHYLPRISCSLLQGMHRRTLLTKDQLQPPSRIAQENTTYQGSAAASFKECTGEHYLPRISCSLLQGLHRRTLLTKEQLQPPSRNAQENTTYQGSAAASFKECTGEHYLPRISCSLLQGMHRRTLLTKEQLQPPSRNAQENTTYQGSAAASFKECTGEHYLPRISCSLLQGMHRRTLLTKDQLQPPSRNAQENTTHQGSAAASFKECIGEHYLPRISCSLLQGMHRRTLLTKDQLQPPSRIAQENTTYQGSAAASFKECTGEHYLPRISCSLLQGLHRRTLLTKEQLQPPSRNAQENTTYQGSAAASFKECTGEHYLPRISCSLLQGMHRRTLLTKDQLQPPSRNAQENTTYQGAAAASFKECTGEHYLPRISCSLLQGMHRRTLLTKDQLQPPSRNAQENTAYQGSAAASFKECTGEHYLPRISCSLLQGMHRRTLLTKDQLQPPSRNAQENTTYQGSAAASFKECTGEHYLPRISCSLLQGMHRRTLLTKDQLQPPLDLVTVDQERELHNTKQLNCYSSSL